VTRWFETENGPELWSRLTNRRLAQVKWTGSLWRGTTWTHKGSSSATGTSLKDAIEWCNDVLRRNA